MEPRCRDRHWNQSVTWHHDGCLSGCSHAVSPQSGGFAARQPHRLSVAASSPPSVHPYRNQGVPHGGAPAFAQGSGRGGAQESVCPGSPTLVVGTACSRRLGGGCGHSCTGDRTFADSAPEEASSARRTSPVSDSSAEEHPLVGAVKLLHRITAADPRCVDHVPQLDCSCGEPLLNECFGFRCSGVGEASDLLQLIGLLDQGSGVP